MARTVYSALLVATTVLAWGCEGGCGCSPGRVSEAPETSTPDEADRTPRRKKALPSIGLKGDRADAPEPSPTPPEPAIDGGAPPAQRDGGAPAPNLDSSVDGRPAPAPTPVPILPPSFVDAGGGATPDLNPTPIVPIAPPNAFLDGGANNFAPPPLPVFLDAGTAAPAPIGAGADSGAHFRFDSGFKDAQANPSPAYYDGGARFAPPSYFDASR